MLQWLRDENGALIYLDKSQFDYVMAMFRVRIIIWRASMISQGLATNLPIGEGSGRQFISLATFSRNVHETEEYWTGSTIMECVYTKYATGKARFQNISKILNLVLPFKINRKGIDLEAIHTIFGQLAFPGRRVRNALDEIVTQIY